MLEMFSVPSFDSARNAGSRTASQVNLTSADVNGTPSDQSTPGLR